MRKYRSAHRADKKYPNNYQAEVAVSEQHLLQIGDNALKDGVTIGRTETNRETPLSRPLISDTKAGNWNEWNVEEHYPLRRRVLAISLEVALAIKCRSYAV